MLIATVVSKPAGKLVSEMFASFGMPFAAFSFIAVLFMENFNHMVFSAVHSNFTITSLEIFEHCSLHFIFSFDFFLKY